jgi:hypothetical protein
MKICSVPFNCELYNDNRCCCECEDYKCRKDIPCYCSYLVNIKGRLICQENKIVESGT